jgi:radical SAM/Cys-rich protein
MIPKLKEYLDHIKPESLEITGGAPELNENIVTLIREIRPRVKKLTMRTNLTAMSLCSFSGFPDFLYDNKVGLVASLPCFSEDKVDSQRGSGVFENSIRQLNQLNSLGFGVEGGVPVTLVYNPTDYALPPNQIDVEKEFKEKLSGSYGIKFTDLVTMTNVPVGRFAVDLKEKGYFRDYLRTLSDSFNRDTLPRLMCLDQVTIDWRGRFYDCDFNLALSLPSSGWSDLDSYREKHEIGRKIYTGYHCLACTAGSGSSCHGSLAGE